MLDKKNNYGWRSKTKIKLGKSRVILKSRWAFVDTNIEKLKIKK
jgi:hypothetical protein